MFHRCRKTSSLQIFLSKLNQMLEWDIQAPSSDDSPQNAKICITYRPYKVKRVPEHIPRYDQSQKFKYSGNSYMAG